MAELTASLAWGLIKNHAFIDGNKRVGLGAAAVLLRLNGYRFACSEPEQIDMVLRCAAGEITEEQWTVWVMRVVAPMG